MKSLTIIFLFLAGISAAHAIANPASVYCEKLGGKSEIATLNKGGQIGLCLFPNGRIFEEWTLFRTFNGGKPQLQKAKVK
jgi:uncharacterized protein